MDFINEEIMLLNEGGAAGHLAHPFEDADLTFGDMKEMINRGLIGGLDKEGPVTEKLDGQNIAFSVKDGKIVFARNKGHVRNRGENALDRNGIAKQFAGRGGIEKAFTGAAEDLEAAIKKLTPQQIKKMFGNGSKFMSLEVILPDTQNVIPYGKSVLVMHGTISYDKEGNEVSRDAEEGREFGDAVKKVGADRQKTFGIAGAKSIVFSDVDEKQNRKKANEYINDITRTAKQFGLSDKSKLEDYRRKWWDKELDNQEKKLGIKFSKSERNGLIKRWANGDKSFGVKNFDSDKKKNWFRKYEDSSLEKSQKTMIKPIENTFLKTGAHTLKRVTNFISSNNPKTAEQVKKDVITAIKAIKDSKDPAKLAKLQKELERLKEIGMDNVVPSEGLVFMYKGKPYKFTGAFAPINQITGTFKFDMPKEMKSEPKAKQKYEKETKTDKKKVSGQPKKTVAVFVGRFQPFHAGHYSVYAELVKRFGKENVYIGSSDVTDDVKSPFRFSEKKEIMTKMFGVPSSNVVKVKNPYQPTEILDKVGKDTTYVTAVSQKDAERLDKGGKYFKNYDKTPTGKHKKYKDEGYYIIAPEMQLKVNGANISGTQLRATFGNQLLTKSEKVNIFKQIYPKFDKDIYNKIVQKTTKAEQAKAASSKKEKQKELPKGKNTTQKLDKHTTKKLKSVLNKKIINPKTGNKILVKSALKYEKGNKARKAAEAEVKKALKSRNENFPGGVFTGLTSPAGYINGAPDPEDVKKMRKKLNKNESVESLFSSILTEEAFEKWIDEYFSEHYVSSTGMFNRKLTPQQKIDKLNPARAIQKGKIWHKTFSHHNPETGEIENQEESISDSKNNSIKHFVEWASKRLKLSETPKIELVNGTEISETQSSLGGYNPETKSIFVQTENRLSADIIRTIAHEMVHRKQDELGLIKNPLKDGATGSPIENQANAIAGILLREYGKINKKIYTEDKKFINEAIIDDKFDSVIGDIKDEMSKKYNSLKSVKYDTHDKTYTFIFSDEKEANIFRTDFQGTDSQNVQFDKIDYEPKQDPTLFFVKFKTQFKENKKSTLNEVSALAGADAQPDGAFLPKGKTRILGKKDNVNKKDNWFLNGGYTQTDFPTADPIFGDEDAELVTIWYAHKNVPRTDSTIKTDFINESNFEKHTEKLLSIIQKK